jgi:uncharacterized protein (DUF433 family)
MINIYEDAMMTVADASLYLQVPPSTVSYWRRTGTIHSLEPKRRGWPSLPFAAVVETFVLRTLRAETGLPAREVREAAAGVRRAFADEYGLVRPRLVHDGVQIFIQEGNKLYRARDQHQVIPETVHTFKTLITWDGEDPTRLKLAHFGSDVILDPRFGWGKPVIESNKVPVEAIMGLWRAREPVEAIADEYRMKSDEIIRLAQGYAAVRDRQAA